MLYPRIIPSLLVHKKGLTKTIRFRDHKYVGDPINAVRIFNEKEVDELIVLDIDASTSGYEPDYRMIENIANESRMPLCYGGGIKTADQAQKVFRLGVEKVAISSIALEKPEIVSEIANRVGNQSVLVVLDVKKKSIGEKYEIYTHNAKINTKKDPIEMAAYYESLGAGEIVINSIDNDGVMKGYDIKLIRKIRDVINTPLTVIGGAGSLNDFHELISEHGIIGAAAGSLFVFKGRYRAVLINYPRPNDKIRLIEEALSEYYENRKNVKK